MISLYIWSGAFLQISTTVVLSYIYIYSGVLGVLLLMLNGSVYGPMDMSMPSCHGLLVDVSSVPLWKNTCDPQSCCILFWVVSTSSLPVNDSIGSFLTLGCGFVRYAAYARSFGQDPTDQTVFKTDPLP